MPLLFTPECPSCHMQSKQHWIQASIYCCTNCALLFRYPFPDTANLIDLYQQSWQKPQVSVTETGGTSTSLASTYANRLVGSLGLPHLGGLKLLDFGAGRGAMLEALTALGAEVYAVEPFGYDYLAKRGHRVYPGLDDIPKNLQFDGIISLDVIEHLEAPREFLGKLKMRLRRRGWLHLATPNAASLNARVTGPYWREVQNQGHLVFFSPGSLSWVLRESDYQNIRRLRWFVKYDSHPVRRLIHFVLQLTSLDGELRYLAWNH